MLLSHIILYVTGTSTDCGFEYQQARCELLTNR